MSALLEIIKEAPPEDRKAAAKLLKPYLSVESHPHVDRLLTVPEFHDELAQRIGIKKRVDWIRNDMFVACPELKRFAFGRNAGTGHPLWIDERALDWIADHHDEIDWRG